MQQLHILIYNCTNCHQLHVKICPSLYYIFSNLWVENHNYVMNLKNFICVGIVKCQVKLCLLPDYYTDF